MSLPPEKLFDLDERLRGYSSMVFGEWPTTALTQITTGELEPALRQPLLFLSAGQNDGRLRQKTLWKLPEFPGYLALAIALIRCADWVPEVRHAAHDATMRLLELSDGQDVVALWPLVLRLRSRERGSLEWLENHVESWVLRTESLPLLRALLASDNAKVRAWAFSSSLEAGIDIGVDLLERAVRDPNPAIGLHALRHAQHQGDDVRMRFLAEMGLNAPHPVIRRESLRALSGLEGALTRDKLLVTVCDASAGVRSLSAFLLRDRYSEESLARWRAVLDGDTKRPTFGPLVSLADNAQPEDSNRVQRWLFDPSGSVRMHALRGLLKSGGQLTEDEFSHLVAEGGNRVLRFLASSIRAGDTQLGVERLALSLTSSAIHAPGRLNLRLLLQELGHWQRLELLLQLAANQDTDKEWWRHALSDWVMDSGAYAPMGSNRRLEILRLLEGRHDEIDIAQYEVIKGAILRH
ncbi:MAG TPA: HEAT repeat domain-containing protein [Stenotrophomonas sp.]